MEVSSFRFLNATWVLSRAEIQRGIRLKGKGKVIRGSALDIKRCEFSGFQGNMQIMLRSHEEGETAECLYLCDAQTEVRQKHRSGVNRSPCPSDSDCTYSPTRCPGNGIRMRKIM